MPFLNCNLFYCLLLPRHHVYKKLDHKNIELSEVGPRFEMKCKFLLHETSL